MELEDKYLNKFYDEKRADTFDYNKPFVYKFKYIYKNGTEYELSLIHILCFAVRLLFWGMQTVMKCF